MATAEATRTLRDIQKNINAIRSRSDHLEKLRHTHNSVLRMEPLAQKQDISEFRNELKSIKQSIVNQQKSADDGETKAMLRELNSKVTMIQDWVSNYAIGDAAEITEVREGLRKIDESILDNAPLLQYLVDEVRQIRREEAGMQREIERLENELSAGRARVNAIKPAPAKPQPAKRARPQPAKRARKASASPKPIKRPRKKQAKPAKAAKGEEIRRVISINGPAGQNVADNKKKLRKFMDAIDKM